MKIKCAICGKKINEWESHNGEPVVKGRVCVKCNIDHVIKRRMDDKRK